jgi:hypothetical protein
MPSAVVTVIALLAHPSPASPTLHQLAGVMNLFQDGAKKHHSGLPLMVYSPAKKKGSHVAGGVGGGRHTRSDGIRPHNPFDVLNDNAVEACNDDIDNDKGDPN